jgi:hypothetical protein
MLLGYPSMTSANDLKSPPIRFDGAFARTVAFPESQGLVVRVDAAIDGFLAGVAISDGALLVESCADDIAGELLHEAGHLAVLPSLFRIRASGDLSGISEFMSDWIDTHIAEVGPDHPTIRAILQCGECEAVAWSYAAAVEIGIDTRPPFFRGFEGDGLALHDQVASGYYFGVHALAAAGMTELPRPRSATPFPKMKRWLQI